jgi:pimeloyl-ACP methyl ester carboxylesterase
VSTSDEVRAVGRLAGDVLAGGVGFIGEIHHAIAGRVFRSVGVAAAPVRAVHDTVAGAVYGAVGAAHTVVPLAGVVALTVAAPTAGRRMVRSPVAPRAQAAVNGMWGDAVARRYPELAVEMAVRVGRRPVVADGPGIAAAFPGATSRLAVFVHGLCEDETSWRLGAGSDPRRVPYAERLRHDLGYTPVEVAYNSGLRISENGRSLAVLLDDVVSSWPVPVEEVVLIGHSMGGLVARSACHDAGSTGRRWGGLVRHVFCLGTPHLGAPLEQGVNAASWWLGRLPETRPLASVLNSRSVGVKDLRFGSCVEDDWRDHDPDEFLRDRCTEVPFLPDVAYYFIGGTLTTDPDHPVGRLLGDLLVQLPSASGHGRRRRIPFEVDRGRHLGGVNHIALLNHPAVYEQLHRWLTATADAGGVDGSDGEVPVPV